MINIMSYERLNGKTLSFSLLVCLARSLAPGNENKNYDYESDMNCCL